MKSCLVLMPLVGIAVALIVVGSDTSAARSCQTGRVAAYASVSGTRISGPGGIPSKFTTAQGVFDRRYNCTGRLTSVRRVDEGIYEVRFPRNRGVTATAGALNAEGTSASVERLGGGVFRIILRGSAIDNGVLVPRDTPFAIIVF